MELFKLSNKYKSPLKTGIRYEILYNITIVVQKFDFFDA